MLIPDFILPACVFLIPLLWWVVSSCSVFRFLSQKPFVPAGENLEPLTLFKPLPPLKSPEEYDRYALSIGSFARQLSAVDELLLLVPPEDASYWKTKAAVWESGAGPTVKILSTPQGQEPRHANPKINAMSRLAPLASHGLWWWSDADITVPEGEINLIRREFAASAVALQTQAYVIPAIQRPEDWLDAMFVHIELLPGLTLLSRKEKVDFACGGSLLFRREAFAKTVSWDELGSKLADDNFLGQTLQPVRLGRSLMQTQSGEQGMAASWLHYFRWQKTVRWCNPAGFAGLVFLQPLWLALIICCFTGLPAGLLFFAVLLACEACWVNLLFRRLQILTPCPVFVVAPLWSLVRSATWLLCWFPVAVHWSGIKWWKSKSGTVKS